MSFSSNATRATLAALLLTTVSPVSAQDYNLEPAFGVVSIATGYLPDPNWVSLLAGGDIAASRLTDTGSGLTCAGYVADAPDFRVHYEAGTDFPLTFFAESEADTVLVVNAPDGSWHCNDDYSGLDPAVVFDVPLSGQYDIWVGTYEPISDGSYPGARLSITELSPFADNLERAFFGQDDRVIADSTLAPWTMIGMIEMENGFCTGTLIGPSTVLTAAHCLADGGAITDVPLEFNAGFSRGGSTASSRITGYHVPAPWMQSEADGNDFAFLFLANPIGDQVGWMDVGPLTGAEASAVVAGQGPAVMQGGYSRDQHDVLTVNMACPILEIRANNTVSHQCDTLQGDSGSPLFIATENGFRVIGVESHTMPQPSLEWDDNVAMYTDLVVSELAMVMGSGSGMSAQPVK